MLTFSAGQLQSTASKILVAAGADEANAAVVAEHLVDANLAGHDSHGVIRIPTYVRGIKQGSIAASARPEIVRQTAAMTLIDAHYTFGQVSSLFATDNVVTKAREHGVAIGATFNSRHVGRLGYYPTRAAAQGVALLVALGNLGNAAAPFGGRTGVMGTNPISFGFPSDGQQGPFLLDFATTAVAYGKVMIARDKHEQVPPGALLDKEGWPTTDPNALMQGGALLPFGSHKGYALALMATLLSTVLVREGEDREGGDSTKVFFCAIDTRVFGDDESKLHGGAGGGEGVLRRHVTSAPQAASTVFEKVRATPPAEGFDEVLIPGEPERRSAERRRKEGIPVAEDTWQAIMKTASEVGVSV